MRAEDKPPITTAEADSMVETKTAQRVTKESIEAKIQRVSYQVDGTLTVSVVEMQNGFKVVGLSACASPANFDPAIGQRFAYDDAIRQIWPLEGYALCERLHAEMQRDAKVAEGFAAVAEGIGGPIDLDEGCDMTEFMEMREGDRISLVVTQVDNGWIVRVFDANRPGEGTVRVAETPGRLQLIVTEWACGHPNKGLKAEQQDVTWSLDASPPSPRPGWADRK